MSIQRLISELVSFKSPCVFNPYNDICEVFDKKNANLIRLNNLELILAELSRKKIESIWIGRDLGHRGGRRTGLALTDEGSLPFASNLWGVELHKATKGSAAYERTAANIWSYAGLLKCNIFMWNVFPFHPHEANRPFTNRSHTAGERDVGLAILQSVLDILQPKNIVAIGNDAYRCALKVHNHEHVFKIRHPSYGGEKEFSNQISGLYGLNDYHIPNF